MTKPGSQINFDDIPVEVEAAIEGPPLPVGGLLGLQVGSVLVTEQRVGENIAVFAGAARIGYGELSNRDGRTLIRIVRLGEAF